jgi:O-antigen ligase
MKNVFYIKDSVENRISYYHLLFFLFALPFDRFYSTILLISYLIHSLIYFRKNHWKHINPNVLILQSVFFVSVASAFYAPSASESLNVITKQLAIFIFPVLFSLGSLDLAKYRDRLLTGLGICCTMTILYLYGYAIYVIRLNKLPLKELFSWAFVNHNFSMPIDMHATYLSMLLVLSIVHCLRQFLKEKLKAARTYFMTGICIQFAGLIQLSSKSALIALFLIVVFGFPGLLIRKNARYRFVFVSLIVSAGLIAGILSRPVFRERYVDTLRDDLFGNKNEVEMNGRFDRWTTAGILIKKSPFIGTGAGSEVPLLRDLYFERKMYLSYLDSLNAHNQYLSFIINSGLVGLAVYLASLAWGFWLSVKKRDLMLLTFIIVVSIVSISEDLLMVNKGIYFYAFFFAFLVRSERNSRSRKFQALQPRPEFNVLYH